MKKRMVLITAFILALVLLPSCPGTPSDLVGTWIMDINSVNDVGLELMENGSAVSFEVPPGPALTGTLTWEVDGSEFILCQQTVDSMFIYVGHVDSSTSMSGAFVSWQGASLGTSGTWEAMKL